MIPWVWWSGSVCKILSSEVHSQALIRQPIWFSKFLNVITTPFGLPNINNLHIYTIIL